MDTRRGGPVKIMVAPNRYIQGAGVIKDIGKVKLHSRLILC